MKHVMLGKSLWNRLTSDYQVELIGLDYEFKIKEYHDGFFWDSPNQVCLDNGESFILGS